jgi:acyl-CoA reductase-like NAD-dependent aldehyde dehydrogenase
MSEYRLLINGELVAGERSMDVVNPATEEILAACPVASEGQLDQAVAAAKAAFAGWSVTPIDARKAVVNAIADAIEAKGAELAQLLTQEQGKPIEDATNEVYGTAAFFRYFASLDLPVKVLEDGEHRRVEAHRRPLGVVGAIVPWNFPLILMAFKVPPALVAGNTVVLKPAPTTPLTSLRFGEIVRGIVPPGVVNVITDDNDLGAALTAHPDVRKVSFTGSTATGAKVMAGAAGLLKRITLELGGNDAGVVLDDVDPGAVAPQLFASAFQNSGQVCIALKRFYVHDSIYEEMVESLSAIANDTVIGNGLEQGTKLGPLQNRAQYDKVRELIEDSARSGAIAAGGEVPDMPGYFIRPTIVRDVAEGCRIVDEEQFGPVLPVIRFSDEDDAIDRANGSAYGLGGSIWSSNPDRAYALAQRMEAGTVWINKHAELDPGIPFGGAKQSGLGAELGQEGLEEFTQLKIINMARGAA